MVGNDLSEAIDMSSPLVSRLFALPVLLLVNCKQLNDGSEYDEALAGPRFTGTWVYDTGTLCTAGDATMHCCPPGMAMIGVHIADNVFKCAQLTGTHGGRSLDVDTYRNGMHTCPSGTIAVGLHVNNNQLACQLPTSAQIVEHPSTTPGTMDSYPMRVCPRGYAMTGIRVGDNTLACES